ncbi:MAG: hypothetical protein ACUVXF_01675 [Desulfobaccales bacterium]
MPEEPCFPYLAWLKEVWRRGSPLGACPPQESRPFALTPRQIGAALLMAYVGGFFLVELADLAGCDPDLLKKWRQAPQFLEVMDWSKSRFCKKFPDYILLEDFHWGCYQEIAGEFACLEESLRVRLRTALYPRLETLAEGLISRYRHGIPLETALFPRFRRLFLFFWALEVFWPSPARPQLQERFLPLAQEVVWPTLGLLEKEPLADKPWEDTARVVEVREILALSLREVFLPPGLDQGG